MAEKFRCSKFIITCFLLVFFTFFLHFVSYAQGQEEGIYAEADDFDAFVSVLNQIQSTGGTVVLTDDITVPASEIFTYINGRYRQEVVIETSGHTIYVEGNLELWPFLTIRGNGSQKELIHVYPGGMLRLVSICIDAGENGTAVVQDEGAFLIYGSDENMGLPEFACTGRIVSAETMTAAAYCRYNCEKLPVIRVPDGTDFSADMLPEKVWSNVNRDHMELEEDAPVVWDETMFPTEHQRTLIEGSFTEEYTQYEDYFPQCLVIWESNTRPFFLNVYLEASTQWYDMVFMYGESPQQGTVYVQASDDGKNWSEITDTDGYMPVEAEQNSSFSWILTYSESEPEEVLPKYYRLYQVLEDGTELYSESLCLSENLIFTGADIEGGRGGETTPDEGENQLADPVPDPEMEGEFSNSLSEQESKEQTQQRGWQLKPYISFGDSGHIDESNARTSEPQGSDHAETQSSDSSRNNDSADIQSEETEKNTSSPERSDETAARQNNNISGFKKAVGAVIVVCVLAGCVMLAILKRKQ